MGSFVCGNFFGPNLRPPSKASVENAPDHAEGMPGIPGRSICRLKKLLDTFACVVYRIFVWTWGDNIVINSNFNNIKRHQDVKVRFFPNSLVKQGNTSSKSPHFYANENDETNCTNYTFLCQKKQETNFIANWLRFPPSLFWDRLLFVFCRSNLLFEAPWASLLMNGLTAINRYYSETNLPK